MISLLILLFILCSFPAWGNDCTKIKNPDLSSLDWKLADETIFENKDLRIGLRFKNTSTFFKSLNKQYSFKNFD